jgi:pimeloyl-ACP methyl ester carboxylesterase
VEIERVDLGVCDGYFYAGDPDRCAAVLPGAMLGGMPVNAFVIAALVADGWSVVQVWDEYGGDFDSEPERLGWAHTRAEAAIAAAPNGNVRLISGKSLTSLTTGLAAERRLAAIWLTPLLHDETCVAGLRRKNAPALLIGGTEDEVWDGPLARELADEVLELEGGDHGLARVEDVARVQETVAAFAAGI